jgi:hypothetical protein
MKDYILQGTETPPSDHVWAFDLGSGSHDQKQNRPDLLWPVLFKKRFLTGVSAWRIGNQFALSNFVLIPI